LEAQPLDEYTWLSCQEPQAMLAWLRNSAKPSERKLRLFGCACMRRVWHLLTDERSRTAVEVAEQYAEGAVTRTQLRVARADAEKCIMQATATVGNDPVGPTFHAAVATVAWWMTSPWLGRASARVAGQTALFCAADTARPWAAASFGQHVDADAAFGTAEDAERRGQADLLRDLFGPLPFRPMKLDPAWRAPTVRAVAQRAYEERQLPSGTLDATQLRVLADALEEAGCDSADILSHLREQGAAHLHGCWVVDLLVEKQ
jgi:hypothetical protein